MMNRLSLVVFLLALAILPVTAHADPAPTQPPLPAGHPVAGWVYELTYEVDTGKVISLVAYDENGPPFYGERRGRTATVVEPGQVVIDISADPRLPGVMSDVDAYHIDIQTGQVKEKAANPISKADTFRLDYILSVSLFGAAAVTILGVRRFKGREKQ